MQSCLMDFLLVIAIGLMVIESGCAGKPGSESDLGSNYGTSDALALIDNHDETDCLEPGSDDVPQILSTCPDEPPPQDEPCVGDLECGYDCMDTYPPGFKRCFCEKGRWLCYPCVYHCSWCDIYDNDVHDIVENGESSDCSDTSDGYEKGSCQWYFECTKDCPPVTEGTACVLHCKESLTPQVLSEIEILSNCIEANGCSDKSTEEEVSICIEDFCLEPYFKCYSGETLATCYDLKTCIADSPDDDPDTTEIDEELEFEEQCWSHSSVEAQWAMHDLLECISDNCESCEQASDNAGCQTCHKQVVGEDGPCDLLDEACDYYGIWGCGLILECLAKCMGNACAQECISNGSKEGVEAYDGLIGCGLENCPQCEDTPPGEDCDACFNASINEGGVCYEKTEACIADTTVD